VYHVLNRRVMRLPLFEKEADYAAFQDLLLAALLRPDAPGLLAYCLMPNHWHLVLQAGSQTNLSTWMQWLTVTHTHRWHAHRRTAGEGPLYQGRFKSFPVQQDEHFLTLCRYVEANALRARLVRRAENWRWGSLWLREHGPADACALLADWPTPRPRRWLEDVNRPLDDARAARLRESITRGRPLGDEGWTARAVAKLGLETSLRPRGRPRKQAEKSS
jgi:putative transposase